MPGSITQFISEFDKWGASKVSHFDVFIPPMGDVIGGLAIPTELLTFRCESAELPGRQLVSNDIKIYGPIYKTPFQSLYSETTLTFIETANLDVRKFFEAWMNAIWDSNTNALQYPDTYMKDIEIRQYDVTAVNKDPGKPESLTNGIAGGPQVTTDKNGRKVYKASTPNLKRVLTAKLYQSFPTNINQMTTAWGDDSLHRLQISFFYRYYDLFETEEVIAPAPVSTSGPSGVPQYVKDAGGIS